MSIGLDFVILNVGFLLPSIIAIKRDDKNSSVTQRHVINVYHYY